MFKKMPIFLILFIGIIFMFNISNVHAASWFNGADKKDKDEQTYRPAFYPDDTDWPEVVEEFDVPLQPILLDPNNAVAEQGMSAEALSYLLSRGYVPCAWKLGNPDVKISSYTTYEVSVSTSSQMTTLANGDIGFKDVIRTSSFSGEKINENSMPHFIVSLDDTPDDKIASGEYFIAVRAINQSGTFEKKGSWSNVVSVNIANEIERTGVTLSAVETNVTLPLVQLNWTPIGEHSIYQVHVSDKSDFSNSIFLLENVYSINTPNYTKQLDEEKTGTYYFRVREVVQLSNIGVSQVPMPWSNAVAVNYAKDPGVILDELVLAKSSDQLDIDRNGEVVLDWWFAGQTRETTDYKKYEGYEVHISKGDQEVTDYVASSSFYSEVDNSLLPFIYIRDLNVLDMFEDNQTYSFKVRGVVLQGHSVYTNWSNSISITVEKNISLPTPELTSDPVSSGNTLDSAHRKLKSAFRGNSSYNFVNYFDIIIKSQDSSVVKYYEFQESELNDSAEVVDVKTVILQRTNDNQINITRSPDYLVSGTPQQLKYNTTYKYQVRACDHDPASSIVEDKVYSEWSDEFFVNIKAKGQSGWR